MKKSAKVLSLVMAAAMMCAAFAGCGKKSYTANNKEYVIGLSGPLTGAAAIYGNGVKNGAQLAVDEINAAGGLNGVKFRLEVTDDMQPRLLPTMLLSLKKVCRLL